jgi:murein DD-endopeptidase MepM/ murein hydrolase activator NlpD
MSGARIPRFALMAVVLVAICCAPMGAQSSAGVVTLTPATVEAGSPELIHVDAPAEAIVDGEWIGKKLEFFRIRGEQGWFALAGVDVEAATGPTTLRIEEKPANGTKGGGMGPGLPRDLSRTVEILPAHYRTGTLTVAPQFVSPPPAALKEIEAEVGLKDKVFAESAPERLWAGDFRAPVAAEPTDSFGTRRMFNGKLASVHKGMDFRARMGTPVHAGNSGMVVLAQKLYYEGNCVVIDHGLGLYTISMHLSRIDVLVGEHVAKGQLLGLSGATGRVTGPHLHWAVRWGNAYLDPAKLLRMNLSAVR